MIKAGVFGASGYMGGEVLRLLLEHPEVELVWATSRNHKPVEFYHRNLYGANIKFIKPEEITPCDVIFFAIPTGSVMSMAKVLLKSNTKIIDLGADFRLKNAVEWENVYGKKHLCPEYLNDAIYGIPEIYREKIKSAKIIANPGCFSSAAILGLAPLIKNNLIDMEKIVVDGLSGTAGAGAELDVAIHHPEIGNNVVVYNAVNHRHSYEIEQELGFLSNKKVTVHFTPSYVPITRGILDICHCFPTKKLKREELISLYQNFYRNEYFIKIFDMPFDHNAVWQHSRYPWVSSVSGTNFCHIGLDIDEKRNRLIVLSVLDSLGKGGAHVGIQNLNIMFGFNETLGISQYGLHPY